jgi:hypothetical protein
VVADVIELSVPSPVREMVLIDHSQEGEDKDLLDADDAMVHANVNTKTKRMRNSARTCL